MAESLSDSSELRDFLRELRQRTAGGPPSRIPKPEQPGTDFSLAEGSAHEAARGNAHSSSNVATRSSRATALLNKVAGLGLGHRQRQESRRLDDLGSPTSISSPTVSGSKKEVSFKLDTDRSPKPSKIPRSPKLIKRQAQPSVAPANPPLAKIPSESSKLSKKSSPTRSPDVGRHQARRSPSPFHKNCQHSLSCNSPERQRTPSPRIKRSIKVRKGVGKGKSVASSTTSEDTSTTRRDTKSDSDVSPDHNRSHSLKSSSSALNVAASKSNKPSPQGRIADKTKASQSSSVEYSDTFEESTSRTKSASSKPTRSKSLDTGLSNQTFVDEVTTTVPTTSSRSSARTLKKSRSASSASSKSTIVPDWWFPAILPPQHFGGKHLEELQKIHAGVLDDLFRFQIGLIEKHHQRAESRHKAVREFVRKKHEYTNWRSYQDDPRLQFVRWQRESGAYVEAP